MNVSFVCVGDRSGVYRRRKHAMTMEIKALCSSSMFCRIVGSVWLKMGGRLSMPALRHEGMAREEEWRVERARYREEVVGVM